MSNFLDVNEQFLRKKLDLEADTGEDSNELWQDHGLKKLLTPSDKQLMAQSKFLLPHPGFCIKTKDKKTGEKVFINLCHSEDVPEPEFDYTDERLAQILSDEDDNSEDIESIRIPMSIGEKHSDIDKSGKSCEAADIVINSAFFREKILISDLYQSFLIQVSMEGVNEKYKFDLDVNGYTILTNRKSFGKLQPQFVRQKPSIREINTNKKENTKNSCLIEEIPTPDRSIAKLDCTFVQYSPHLLVVETKLPELNNINNVIVNVSENQVLIKSPAGEVDAYLPLKIDISNLERCKSEFYEATKILKLSLPLIKD